MISVPTQMICLAVDAICICLYLRPLAFACSGYLLKLANQNQIKKPHETWPNRRSESIGPFGHSSTRNVPWAGTQEPCSRDYANVVLNTIVLRTYSADGTMSF
jgi:hypothetical protein